MFATPIAVLKTIQNLVFSNKIYLFFYGEFAIKNWELHSRFQSSSTYTGGVGGLCLVPLNSLNLAYGNLTLLMPQSINM